MSNEDISLALEERTVIGKGLNQLKAQGKIPAVIHQPGEDSLSVTGNFTDINAAYAKAGRHHAINVTVGNKKLLTIVKSVDIDPTKQTMRHIVFGAIKQDVKVNTQVPVVLVGEAPALKLALLVHQHIDEITIEALPKDLPDKLEVSVDSLNEVGDKVTVADIKAATGVTIMAEPEELVAVVDEPNIIEEEPQESPAEAEAAAVAEVTGENQDEASDDKKE